MFPAKTRKRQFSRLGCRSDRLKRHDRIRDLLGNQFRREFHAPNRIGTGLDLPTYFCPICRKARAGKHGNHLAFPIHPNEDTNLLKLAVV
jgi:hypothetical protein